jgi:hypothetical protein
MGKIAKMRFVSSIASAAKTAALVHVIALALMLGVLAQPARAQQWVEIPNTQLSPVLADTDELGTGPCAYLGGCPTGWAAWTSLVMDENRDIWAINLGGDADWGGTDSYRLDLDTGWSRVSPVIYPFTGTPDSRGCYPEAAPGIPASQHTYGAVVNLGGGRFFWAGGSAYCKVAKQVNAKSAYFVDTTTLPWTWTPLPHLTNYSSFAAVDITTNAQGVRSIYTIASDGKWAIVDPDTGAIRSFGTIKAAKVNGVTLTGFTSFSSQIGSGAIANGVFLTGNDVALGCTLINGTQDTLNDTRFSRFVRHAFPSGFSGGRFNVTALDDGRFVLWHGGKDVWVGDIDCLNPTADVWEHYSPTTGPTRQNAYTYRKLFEVDGDLIGYSNAGQNAWRFILPEGAPDPDPDPDPDPEPSACTSALPAVIQTHHDKIPNFAVGATICSINGGDWNHAANWDAGRVPSPDDVVVARHNLIGAGADFDRLNIEAGTVRFQGLVHYGNIQVTAAGSLIVDDPAELVCKSSLIDTVMDPAQYGHGIQVIDGGLTIRGQAKTAWMRVGEIPEGWNAGDLLVYPGMQRGQTEIGDNPVHDHAHVGNLTRSVVLRSEGAVRCHVLATGRAAVDVQYAEFRDMGRTTVKPLNNTTFDTEGNAARVGTNQIGRYPLHLHHLLGPTSAEGPQFRVVGNSFAGSPKWAVAVHNSHYGLVQDNVAHNVGGAAFVTEDGSESGNVIDHNLAASIYGHGDGLMERESISGIGNDIGFEGSPFWFRAQRNQITNNVAADAPIAGFMVFPRAGHVGKPLLRSVPMHQSDDPMVSAQLMDVRAAAPYAFDGNEAYAVGRAFEFWYANVAVMNDNVARNAGSVALFLQYHGTAVVNSLTVDGAPEALVGQHGNSLQLRGADITADSLIRMEPNKRGLLFEDVQFNGIAQPSPTYAPFLTMTPVADSHLSGVVTLTFPTVTGGSVIVYVDGKKLKTDTAAPYVVTWDTRQFADGPHWVAAEWQDDRAYVSGRFFVEN